MVCSAFRFPFLLAVALVAAAAGDPLVETISNSGLLGRGYHDNNHVSVLPTFVAGAMLVLVVVAARGLSLLGRGSSLRRGDWLADGAAKLALEPARYDVPVVLALQLAALFAMESAEQLFCGGKLLGGTAWLGGPVAFSLLAHALLGAACTRLFGALARSLHAAIALLVREAIETILLSRAHDPARAVIRRDDEARRPHAQAARVPYIGGRAPPLLPLAA